MAVSEREDCETGKQTNKKAFKSDKDKVETCEWL